MPHEQMNSREPYTALPLFVVMIAGVGSARFVLSVVGVADRLTRYASMTVVIMAGVIWFGSIPTTWRQRLMIAYGLILPYMVIETTGLGYTWIFGQPTIFQAPEYSMGTTVPIHLAGHLIGGLTWEPLSIFAMMSLLAWIFGITRRL